MKNNVIRLKRGETGIYSGIFIICNGVLYINNLKNLEIALHMDLWEILLKMYEELRPYKLYPYYYMPRGSVVASETSDWILLNSPVEFSELQKNKLIKAFGQENKQIEVIDGEHYSLHFVESQVRSNQWDDETIEEEVGFAKKFYMSQINQF